MNHTSGNCMLGVRKAVLSLIPSARRLEEMKGILTLRDLGGVWDCSTNSTMEQLHKKLEFVEYPFRCSHNSTFFTQTECVELKPFD